MKKMVRHGPVAVGFFAIVLAGCSALFPLKFGPVADLVNSDPSAPPPGAQTQSFSTPAATPDSGGNSYTYQLLDRDTGAPITQNVTISVKTGTAPQIGSDGTFTIPNDSGGFRVHADGYSDRTVIKLSSSGKNLAYKQRLYDKILGQWYAYGVVEKGGDTSVSYVLDTNQSVTFGSDGVETWSGDRTYQNPEHYYTINLESNGDMTFWTLPKDWVEHWISFASWIGNGMSRGEIIYYNASQDVIYEYGGEGGFPAIVYSRDGNDPFAGSDSGGGTGGSSGGTGSSGTGGASGTVSFNGSSYDITATDNVGGGSWYVETSGFTIEVVNAPSSGSVSLDDSYYVSGATSAPAVQLVYSSGDAYIAISGSLSVSGGSLKVNAQTKTVTDAVTGGGSSYPLQISVTGA